MFFLKYGRSGEKEPAVNPETVRPVSQDTIGRLLKLINTSMPLGFSTSTQPSVSFYDQPNETARIPSGGILDYRIDLERPDHRLLATISKYRYDKNEGTQPVQATVTHYDIRTNGEEGHMVTKRRERQEAYEGPEYFYHSLEETLDFADRGAAGRSHTMRTPVPVDSFVSESEASQLFSSFSILYPFGRSGYTARQLMLFKSDRDT